MKRVAAAVLLLSCAVLISVWTGYVFNSEMNGLLNSLRELTDCAESSSYETLSSKTGELLEKWHESSKILHALVMHEGMDELEENITALPLILKYSDRSEFKNKCIEAINRIENLVNAEKLNFENILKFREKTFLQFLQN